MLNKGPKKPATYEEYQAMFDRDGDGKDDFDLDGDGKRDVMIDEDDDGIDDFDPHYSVSESCVPAKLPCQGKAEEGPAPPLYAKRS